MRISLLKQLLSILKLKLSRTTFYGGMLPLLQLTFFRECPKLHYKHRTLTILLYNFRDLLKLLCKGICYALSLCKVKALLGFQNLHAYGLYFGAKPCIDVHNTFLRHIISNKSRK